MADDLFDGSENVKDLTDQMFRLDQITTRFGHSLSRALSAGITQGKSFDDILRGLGERLIEISLRAAFKPLETGISGVLGSLVKGVTDLFTGGTSGGSGLFGDLFGSSNGPAGAASAGSFTNAASGASGVTVNMAISTPDADSFRRSEAQISAAMARAVSRGQRSL